MALDRNRGAIRWQREFAGEDIFGGILQLGRRSVLFRKDNLLQAYSAS